MWNDSSNCKVGIYLSYLRCETKADRNYRIQKEESSWQGGKRFQFVCEYKAGCLGYSLYQQLRSDGIDCKKSFHNSYSWMFPVLCVLERRAEYHERLHVSLAPPLLPQTRLHRAAGRNWTTLCRTVRGQPVFLQRRANGGEVSEKSENHYVTQRKQEAGAVIYHSCFLFIIF